MRDGHIKCRKNPNKTQSSPHFQPHLTVIPALSRNPENLQQSKVKKPKPNNFKALAAPKKHPTFFYSKTNPFHHAGNANTQAPKTQLSHNDQRVTTIIFIIKKNKKEYILF